MKVIQKDEIDETKLTKDEKEKVSILKLSNVGQYVEGVGIRDGSFYLIAQDKDDQMYLALMKNNFAMLNAAKKRKMLMIDNEVQSIIWQKLNQLKKNG